MQLFLKVLLILLSLISLCHAESGLFSKYYGHSEREAHRNLEGANLDKKIENRTAKTKKKVSGTIKSSANLKAYKAKLNSLAIGKKAEQYRTKSQSRHSRKALHSTIKKSSARKIPTNKNAGLQKKTKTRSKKPPKMAVKRKGQYKNAKKIRKRR